MKLTEQDKKLCKEVARIFSPFDRCDFDHSTVLHCNYQAALTDPVQETYNGKTGLERIAEILLEVAQENKYE